MRKKNKSILEVCSRVRSLDDGLVACVLKCLAFHFVLFFYFFVFVQQIAASHIDVNFTSHFNFIFYYFFIFIHFFLFCFSGFLGSKLYVFTIQPYTSILKSPCSCLLTTKTKEIFRMKKEIQKCSCCIKVNVRYFESSL